MWNVQWLARINEWDQTFRQGKGQKLDVQIFTEPNFLCRECDFHLSIVTLNLKWNIVNKMEIFAMVSKLPTFQHWTKRPEVSQKYGEPEGGYLFKSAFQIKLKTLQQIKHFLIERAWPKLRLKSQILVSFVSVQRTIMWSECDVNFTNCYPFCKVGNYVNRIKNFTVAWKISALQYQTQKLEVSRAKTMANRIEVVVEIDISDTFENAKTV